MFDHHGGCCQGSRMETNCIFAKLQLRLSGMLHVFAGVIVFTSAHTQDPKEQLLLGPAYATHQLLNQSGLTINVCVRSV